MDVGRASQILGIEPDATDEQVKAAFRALVREHHPDVSAAGDSVLATVRTAELIEAYRVLRARLAGVDPDAAAAEARAGGAGGAGGDGGGGHRAASPSPHLQTERVVRHLGRSKGVRVIVDGDTIAAAVPATELFAALFDAAHELGEVAYTDRSVGLLEIIVEFEGGPVCSVLLTLQGRAAGGMTEAFVTVEPLTLHEPPPTAAVARLIASRVRAHLR